MSSLLTLPPEMLQMVASFLDFRSLLAFSSSSRRLKQLRPDFQTFLVKQDMLWDMTYIRRHRSWGWPNHQTQLMQCPVLFPVEELRVFFPVKELMSCNAEMTLVAFTEEEESKCLVYSSKRPLGAAVREGKSEEIVFKVGLTGSEGASMVLILEDLDPKLLKEMAVTVVNSLNPERKVKKAIPTMIRRLGAQFYMGTHESVIPSTRKENIRQIMVNHANV